MPQFAAYLIDLAIDIASTSGVIYVQATTEIVTYDWPLLLSYWHNEVTSSPDAKSAPWVMEYYCYFCSDQRWF